MKEGSQFPRLILYTYSGIISSHQHDNVHPESAQREERAVGREDAADESVGTHPRGTPECMWPTAAEVMGVPSRELITLGWASLCCCSQFMPLEAPCPRRPCPPHPQLNTSPSSETARLCSAPAATDLIRTPALTISLVIPCVRRCAVRTTASLATPCPIAPLSNLIHLLCSPDQLSTLEVRRSLTAVACPCCCCLDLLSCTSVAEISKVKSPGCK